MLFSNQLKKGQKNRLSSLVAILCLTRAPSHHSPTAPAWEEPHRLSVAAAAATSHGFSIRHPAMTNQGLIDNGNQMMDEADQAIDRSKKVVHDTINVGTDTAAALKAQLHYHPMDFHAIVLFLCVCSHLVGHNGIEGDWRSLTKEEDLELEEQLKHLNKPAAKTIQGGGCPVGTVPIRRTTKEDLIREKLASKIMTPADDTGGADYAIVETIDGPNKYSGASAVLSVHQPGVMGKQYSAGRMMIQNGPDILQVGWRVDPTLFGDSSSRLFIYTNAGQSHCFNTNCPGFVIVDTDIPLGSVIEEVSIRGETPIEMEIYILQDRVNGNWWLGVANTNVGFWPKRILGGGLANLASHAEWGGEVFSPPGIPKPAMGGGQFLIGSTRYDAYFRSIALKSPSGGDINPYTYEFTNSRKLYDVKDEENKGAYFGHLVLYGGPAGS
ncbi:putative plant SNARE 11 [Camellia lanceoleosa]|uniref:Plant SNARE 11 n=1 Tax=Camellia lanceoleosa TaxID=1840588 RepID=A0ACC0H5U1_9ERIC|nr:putative plant SNARE 11 [Camellia lanceoleosa]